MHAYPVVVATTASVEELIPEIVERLRPFAPHQVYLFGSRVRGDGREHSDVDLLVVVPELDGERAELERRMREAVRGLALSADVWAVDRAAVERTGDAVGSFVYPVLREGRVIYGVDERDAHTWLRYAQEDLDAAERMTGERGWTPGIACFHAQQAAEKALKAVLVAEGLPLLYTHNLELLRDAIPDGRRAREADVDVVWLTQWATLPRYPGQEPEASPADSGRAVAEARVLVDAAREDVVGR